MNDRTPAPEPEPCPFCHGSGQISSFRGASRFLLTMEECPACSGTGLELDDESNNSESPPAKRRDTSM